MVVATAPTEIMLPPLHPTQREIAKHPARFKVVCCGRRWGKTVLGIVMCLRTALKGGRVWWVAPVYKQALEGWLYLLNLITRIPNVGVKQDELIVRFPGGGSIQIRTGDNPDNLRGAGLDGVVLDEAAVMKPANWALALRPALSDHKGWAMFISTPKHYNWFYDLYERGEGDSAEWHSWQHPTWDNPFIDAAEIESARSDMLEEDFDQEYGASFTAVGGAVYRLLSANRYKYLRPMPNALDFRKVGEGMDWGTTKQHQAAVVAGGRLSSGFVWLRSSWQDFSGSSDAWRAEAVRGIKDYGATFARVDRSQSSELDRLTAAGFKDVGVGNPHVDVRNAELQSLIIAGNVAWDSQGPGIIEYYNRLCSYHRDEDGKIVEEEDDDVDAGNYLVSELVTETAPKAIGAVRVPMPRPKTTERVGGLWRGR